MWCGGDTAWGRSRTVTDDQTLSDYLGPRPTGSAIWAATTEQTWRCVDKASNNRSRADHERLGTLPQLSGSRDDANYIQTCCPVLIRYAHPEIINHMGLWTLDRADKDWHASRASFLTTCSSGKYKIRCLYHHLIRQRGPYTHSETTSTTITVKTVFKKEKKKEKRSSSYTANTLSTLKFAEHKQQWC